MKGILFKEDMFKAVINGNKTQTRRIIPEKELADDKLMTDKKIQKFLCEARARYKKGEVVFMKEPFAIKEIHQEPPGDPISYLYNTSHLKEDFDFQNKLFMPAKYARYFIKIKDVRVEKLQDISYEDSISEGIRVEYDPDDCRPLYYFYPCNNLRDSTFVGNPITSFYSLWKSINDQDSWDKNPWVFAYELELTEKPLNSN
jgi:hypothetical protein